jgi:hypothetical protein
MRIDGSETHQTHKFPSRFLATILHAPDLECYLVESKVRGHHSIDYLLNSNGSEAYLLYSLPRRITFD